MDKARSAASRRALPSSSQQDHFADPAYSFIDSDQAPPVLAFTTELEVQQNDVRHCHTSGQLYFLRQGIMTVYTDTGWLATPPRFVGWIPPSHPHTVVGSGLLDGWTAFVRPSDTSGLPAHPALLRCSGLVAPAVARLAQYSMEDWRSEAYQRLGEVLLDELRDAEVHGPSLQLPEDQRLRAIADALISNPADGRTSAQLASWAGISTRSLSRHWAAQVGMSIAKYRQVVKVLKSLESLSQGRDIQQIAWDVGFESVSAYINAFKASFGETPRRYQLSREGDASALIVQAE